MRLIELSGDVEVESEGDAEGEKEIVICNWGRKFNHKSKIF